MDELIDIKEFKKQKRYKKPRVNPEQLTEFLKKAPPKLEIVSLIEIYKLDDEGKRKARICGMPQNYRLPTFVPDGIPNPHKVTNPRNEYRCARFAGTQTSHKGIGCCQKHSWLAFIGFNNHKFKKGYNLHRDFKELVKEEFLKAESMTNVALPNETGLADNIDFEGYVEKVREQLKPEELFDSVRYLYELEAIRAALKDQMREEGVSVGHLEMMADQIIKSADFQSKMAKRDADLMQATALQMQTKTMIAGLLHIVKDCIGNEMAVEVLKRIKSDLVLPMNEVGATELLRRQQAAGITDNAATMAEVVEADFEVA